MKRLRLPLILALVAVIATAAVAWAYWTSTGSGSGSGSLGTLTAPAIDVPDTATGSVEVTWTQQATVTGGPASEITYTVERQKDSGSFQPITTGGCAEPVAHGTTSCTDDTVAESGSYTYRAVAKFRSWTATSDPAGPVAVAGGPAAPVSVALANGGGVGNAYINAANAASVSVAVGLEDSTAGDVVGVKITDAGEETAEETATAVGGATETVTVTGIDASALEDGSVTLRATSSNGSGASSEATATVIKDTVKPSSAADTVANITSGTTFTVPYISADASPSSTLDKIELYVDDPGAGGFVLVPGVTDMSPSASGESFSYTGATQDGTYGFYTRATDKAGNIEDAPGAADQTATRDTDPAPTAVDVQTTNAGGSSGQGRLRSGDALVLTFSEAIKSTSILSTWTNAAASVTGQMILKENVATDRLEALGALNIGVIGLENFVDDGDETFNVTLALNAARTVLTITFGSNSGPGTLRTGSAGAATMQWTPDADITDDADQGIGTTPVNEGGGSDSDF
jgi:hypothetical protein